MTKMTFYASNSVYACVHARSTGKEAEIENFQFGV